MTNYAEIFKTSTRISNQEAFKNFVDNMGQYNSKVHSNSSSVVHKESDTQNVVEKYMKTIVKIKNELGQGYEKVFEKSMDFKSFSTSTKYFDGVVTTPKMSVTLKNKYLKTGSFLVSKKY